MSHPVAGAAPPEQMRRFLDSWIYEPEAFLIDEIVSLDREAGTVEARMETTRPLPFAPLPFWQEETLIYRGDPSAVFVEKKVL